MIILAQGRHANAINQRVHQSPQQVDSACSCRTSDIDFLVDFPPGYDLFAQRLPLAQRLSEITGRALDLIPEHELNAHLRDAVLREAIEL